MFEEEKLIFWIYCVICIFHKTIAHSNSYDILVTTRVVLVTKTLVTYFHQVYLYNKMLFNNLSKELLLYIGILLYNEK